MINPISELGYRLREMSFKKRIMVMSAPIGIILAVNMIAKFVVTGSVLP